MPTTSRTVTVARPVEIVAAYLSDFSTSADWDPHTVSCRRLDEGPLRVGARFENVQRLAGHESVLTYTVTEHDPGQRLVLEGGNDSVHTRDEMVFSRTAQGGTTVTYTVTVELQGLLVAGTPLVPAMMTKIADDGAAGMRAKLFTL